MLGLGLGSASALSKIYGGFKSNRVADRSRRDKRELALKGLALRKEEMAADEKQRAFNRLLKLMSGTQALRKEASAAGRLKALRS